FTPEGSNRLRIVSDECHRLAASAHLNGGTLAEVQKALGEGSPELTLWGEITARANWSRANMRDHLRVILESEGSTVTAEVVGPDPDWRDIWTELGRLCKRRAADRVVAAKVITPEIAELLAAKQANSPEDADSLERFYLERFYHVDPDADLVLADNGGRRREALRRLEGLAFVDIVKAFDQRQVEALDPQMPTIWDLSHNHLEREVMVNLGIPEFLEFALAGGEWTKESPEVKAVADKVRANAEAVRQALRFSVSSKSTDTQLIGEIITRLGLKTTSTQKRVTPQPLEGDKARGVSRQKSGRVRVYSLDRDHLAEVVGILTRRHQRRQQGSNPIPVENIPDTALTRLILADQPQSSVPKVDDPPLPQGDPVGAGS
ncbi:MAG: hypothetical protein HC924_14235, partial [Synechococcaceae cyanobacterium SM2_3_2]|nr:hypothetical protein [Synechococcaceae cyanobacterium SM2_3_2]